SEGISGVTSRFEQNHTQQMHEGIVFSEYAVVLPAAVKVFHRNTGKVETLSAIELIHNAQHHTHLTQHNASLVIEPLQKLALSGQWQNSEQEAVSLAPGVRHSV
ncbi:MAG: helicase, partial [bacterium]|nr:helicase [bacterium]